jgi:predicted secreted protein with PEFG-CTERM motif
LIKSGASVSEVNSQIDVIMIKMDTVEVVVPEFGTTPMMILVVAIIGSILFASRSKLMTIKPF